MNTIQLKVTNNRLFDYGLPDKAPQGAGYVLRAVVDEPVLVYAEESAHIPTGVSLSLFDEALAAFVCSGTDLDLVLQDGLTAVASGNQQEIIVKLKNEGQDIVRINPGDVVAQLVFAPVAHPLMKVVSQFEAPGPEIKASGPGELTGLGLAHSPGIQDDPRVFPSELMGNEGPAEDPVYTAPDGVAQNRAGNPPKGLDEVLEQHG